MLTANEFPMHAHHCQADEPGSSQIAFRAVLIAEDTAQPSASLRNAGSSQRRLLVGWAHPLAPTLSDRFHHSLWRPRSGCRKRVGGSRFTPLGVCRNVVQKWRHALRVPESNPGTRDLRHLVKSASASPARRRALMRARHPTAILIREQALRGRPRPLVRRSTSKQVRDRMARTGRHIDPDLRLWICNEVSLLGTVRDEKIARQINRRRAAVRA